MHALEKALNYAMIAVKVDDGSSFFPETSWIFSTRKRERAHEPQSNDRCQRVSISLREVPGRLGPRSDILLVREVKGLGSCNRWARLLAVHAAECEPTLWLL